MLAGIYVFAEGMYYFIKVHNIFPEKYTYVGRLCLLCMFIYKSSSF